MGSESTTRQVLDQKLHLTYINFDNNSKNFLIKIIMSTYKQLYFLINLRYFVTSREKSYGG